MAFLRFAKSIDLRVKDPIVHKHTPYIVILVMAAEEWAAMRDGRFPVTREEKREFKVRSGHSYIFHLFLSCECSLSLFNCH